MKDHPERADDVVVVGDTADAVVKNDTTTTTTTTNTSSSSRQQQHVKYTSLSSSLRQPDGGRSGNDGETLSSCSSIEPYERPFIYRLSILLFAIIQNGLLQGLIYGWVSINQTLLINSKTNGGMELSLHETIIIFTYSSCCSMLSPLVLGLLLDYYGPKICNITSCIIIIIGFQIITMSSSSSSSSSSNVSSISIGFICIAFGGPGIMSSIVHISNLFPTYENFIISILSGSTAISFSIFTIFDSIYENYEGITYKFLFGNYTYIVILLTIISFYVYPNEPYEKYDPELDNDKIHYEEEEDANEISEEHHPLVVVEQPVTTLSTEAPSRLEPGISSHNPVLESDNPRHISHQHHHHHTSQAHVHPFHTSTISKTATLTLEQSLNSYLRKSDSKSFKMLRKTNSFKQSQYAWNIGQIELMSLKDQPFFVQLKSGIYIRSLFVFVSTSYWSNFYVLSLSTEVM